jgi:hypothetical protein
LQAGRTNSRIDSRRERFELNDANAFAGEIRQTLAAPGFLHSTDIHEEAQTPAFVRPFGPLSGRVRVCSQRSLALQTRMAPSQWRN